MINFSSSSESGYIDSSSILHHSFVPREERIVSWLFNFATSFSIVLSNPSLFSNAFHNSLDEHNVFLKGFFRSAPFGCLLGWLCQPSFLIVQEISQQLLFSQTTTCAESDYGHDVLYRCGLGNTNNPSCRVVGILRRRGLRFMLPLLRCIGKTQGISSYPPGRAKYLSFGISLNSNSPFWLVLQACRTQQMSCMCDI